MKKDYGKLIENTLENMDLKISDFWLFEGITEFAKQFPKMSEEKLRKLIALDPTYKGGEQVGKYGNWIIRLFYNNLKNSEMMQQYREFYTKNNGINPKTGKIIEKPELLPATPWEDADKLPNLLKQYDMLKNKIKKPITDFKSIPELYQAIDAFINKGVPQDKKAMERYYVFKDCEKKGLKKIYEDKSWLIGIPETFESSKPFGNFTNWCTTSSYGRYYDAYLRDYGGEYYILLDKRTGELFQFHYESDQFMNESNSRIDMESFTEEEPEISKFLYEYKFKLNPLDIDESMKEINKENELIDKFETTKKNFDEYLKTKLIGNKYNFISNFHGAKDLRLEGDKLIGQMDIDYLGSIIYKDDTRDAISNETICQILTGEMDWYDFNQYNLSDFDYYDSDWNEIAEKYGIDNEYDWDRICRIFYGDDDDDWAENDEIEYINKSILRLLVKNGYEKTIGRAKGQLIMDEIINEYGQVLQPEKLNELLPKDWNVKTTTEEQKEQIQEIIHDNFYDGIGLLYFMTDCKRYGTEQEAEKDVLDVMKDELPITGRNIYVEPNGYSAEFEISKNDLFKIFFMEENHIFENVPNYDDKMEKKNIPTRQELFIPPMHEKWWLDWYNNNDKDNDYYGYENGEDEDWLYLWRVVNGKCDMDDGTYGAFSVSQPYYGWDGFDEKYMKEGFESAAKKIATIKNDNSKKEEKINKEVDKQISEVLRFAK